MNQKVINELHDLTCEFGNLYLLFHRGFSDEGAKKTFEEMYSDFLKKKQLFDELNEELPRDVRKLMKKAFTKLKHEK